MQKSEFVGYENKAINLLDGYKQYQDEHENKVPEINQIDTLIDVNIISFV